jgi:hypothetical protein
MARRRVFQEFLLDDPHGYNLYPPPEKVKAFSIGLHAA